MTSLAWGEIRRRWRGALAVGLVLGLGFAAALTAAAGARRTETAYPRMLEVSSSADVLLGIEVEEGDVEGARVAYAEAAKLPGVAHLGRLAGIQLVPMSVPRGEGEFVESCADVALDDVALRQVERPVVVEGRLPERAEEVIIGRSYADLYGVGVGDRLDFVIYVGDDLRAAGAVTADDGPVVPATIVGIGQTANRVVPFSDLEASPWLAAGPGLAEKYAPTPDLWCYDAALVDLDDGAEPARIAGALEDAGYSIFFQDQGGGQRNTTRAIQPQVTALWVFAAVAATATLLVGIQLLGRQLAQRVDDAGPVWRAVGLTEGSVGALATAPTVVSAVVAAVLAGASAFAFSDRFPIGPARLAEPHPGRALHWSWHVAAAAGLVILIVGIGALAAWRATRHRQRTDRVGLLARLGAVASHPPAIVGVNLAVGSGRGSSAVPLRSAAAGAALALAAVMATITVAAALDDLVTDPARYGRDWDVMVDGLFGPVAVATLDERLGDDPAVEAFAIGKYGEVTINGERVSTVGLSDVHGRTFPALIDGRAPTGADEIVAGRTTLRDLDIDLGDVVAFDAGEGAREVTVVGLAAFPKLNRGSFSTLALGDGAMARTEAFPTRELPPVEEFPPDLRPEDLLGPDGGLYEFATIRLRGDATEADRARVLAVSEEVAAKAFSEVRLEQRPAAIDNYAAVRTTPLVLTLVLSAMAAATLGHLVVSVIRRRGHDLALCAALGMRRRQVLGAVVLHALLVAGLAVVVGVPVGVAAGRLTWQGLATELGVVDTVRVPVLLLAAAAVAVWAVVAVVAWVPGWLAARRPPAAVLRSE